VCRPTLNNNNNNNNNNNVCNNKQTHTKNKTKARRDDTVANENASESGAANVSANGVANANESGAVNENASDGDWAVRVRADVRILAPLGIVSPRVPVDDN